MPDCSGMCFIDFKLYLFAKSYAIVTFDIETHVIVTHNVKIFDK